MESGETQYTPERERAHSLTQQSSGKATSTPLGCEGYEEYAAACDEANPEKAPGVPKPRLALEEMEEETLNNGMFAFILSYFLSNIFLEVWNSTH